MKIEADFYQDLIHWCSKQLAAAGYRCKVDPESPDLPVLQYFNVQGNVLPAQPRRVKRASSLRCPVIHRTGLARLLRKARRGDLLLPHASRSIMNADFGDSMLNDWGIHHFHLGTALCQDGFVGRTSALLFAFVSDDAFHCIDVLDHKDACGLSNFAEQQLLEVVHAHWPGLLADAIPPGAQGEPFEKETLAALRQGGFATLTVMADGTTYATPGGGFVSSKHSMRARHRADRLLDVVHAAENELRAKIGDLAATADLVGKPLPPEPTFELMFRDGWVCAVERTAMLCVELIPLTKSAAESAPRA